MSALQNKLPLKEFKKIWQVRGEREREERGRGKEGEGGGEGEKKRKRERERERELKCYNSTGPSDFNIHSQNGDSVLMVAVQFARVEVLRFLLESAKACRPGQLISPGQAATLRK